MNGRNSTFYPKGHKSKTSPEPVDFSELTDALNDLFSESMCESNSTQESLDNTTAEYYNSAVKSFNLPEDITEISQIRLGERMEASDKGVQNFNVGKPLTAADLGDIPEMQDPYKRSHSPRSKRESDYFKLLGVEAEVQVLTPREKGLHCDKDTLLICSQKS